MDSALPTGPWTLTKSNGPRTTNSPSKSRNSEERNPSDCLRMRSDCFKLKSSSSSLSSSSSSSSSLLLSSSSSSSSSSLDLSSGLRFFSSVVSVVLSGLSRMKKAVFQIRKLHVGIIVVIALMIIAAQIRPPCLWSYLVFKQYPRLTPADNHDVTLVTAYFNLGHFEKAGETFGLYKYLHWSQVFQYVQNPLVVFTDSEQLENMLLQTRRHLANRTKIIRVQRSRLKAFQSVDRIRTIFKDPGYPKHFPNTVIPEYPCSQHAKYEFVKEALERNHFSSTKFIAWIDIGYFRYITKRRRRFYIVTPPNMDESKIAMTQIHPRDPSLFPSDIFRQNLVWVGGGMSVGTREVFQTFVEEYDVATETFLEEGLSSTDQQVIYSMFTDIYRLTKRLQTRIQTYRWMFDCVRSCWFYLGYLCYREVE